MAARTTKSLTKTTNDPTHISDLVSDPSNRRTHNARNLGMVSDALREVGAARSIVIDENDVILAGNGVTEAAAGAGITKVRVVEADGQEIIAVRRRGLTDAQKRALAIYDNRTAELASWNGEQLEADQAAGLSLQPFWNPEEVPALFSGAAVDEIERLAAAERKAQESTNGEAVTSGDFQTFSCPLSVEQERTVRSALRLARRVYQVTTAGDALAAALAAWTASQQD